MSQNKKEAPKLCYKCQQMYGHPNFNQMCSLCFKLTIAQKKKCIQEKQVNLFPQQIFRKETRQQKSQIKLNDAMKKAACPIEKKLEVINKQEPSQISKQDKKQIPKCQRCNKKLRLLGYNCKHCSNQFCKLHRLPEDHDCGVDFISLGKRKLRQDNPLIEKTKIQKI